ncbi:MAG: hypothetical protein HRT68_02840 [Flavobacteriaceae bacterium]|nr:hypothetical protein [Flavobacteriaceae bacterium]
MQEKIVSELKKLAQIIANMDANTDIQELQQKAKSLYEKLTVLQYIANSLEEISVEHSDFEKLVEEVKPEETLEDILADVAEPVFEVKEPETIPDLTSEPVSEHNNIPDLEEEVLATPEPEIEEEPTAQHVESFEEVFKAVLPEPEFVKNDPEEVTPEIPETPKAEAPKVAETRKVPKEKEVEKKAKSLNDRLNTTIAIGLNDKIGFINHLFGGSSEDFNRVISQLNTLSSEDEAKSFITTMVKPDYGNWQGKEEYEERLMALIEKKFS